MDEHCWTLDKPMASLSNCHLGLWHGWQILLNLVTTVYNPVPSFVHPAPSIALDRCLSPTTVYNPVSSCIVSVHPAPSIALDGCISPIIVYNPVPSCIVSVHPAPSISSIQHTDRSIKLTDSSIQHTDSSMR